MLDEFEDADLGWFWATDANSKLIYLSDNAAAQFGSTPDELLGKSLSELFILEKDEDDDEQATQRPLPFLLRARNSISDLAVRIAIDGEEKVWWSISGKPQLDSEGEFHGYRGSAKDTEAAGPRYLGHDVAAMAEGKQREFDSQTITER